MTKKRKILVTKKRFERIVIKSRRLNDRYINCNLCADKNVMILIKEVCSVFGISIRSIFRFIEDGQIHFFETPTGEIFVCITSLQATMEKLNLQK